ncbi:MAG: DUF3037 domain-containing protein, partial [Chthoniobacterales bacterium]
IVLIQAKAGFFDFAIAKHWKRVTGFFPELDADIYRAGLRFVRLELEQFKSYFGDAANVPRLALEFSGMGAAFANLVRPRESIFRYSGIRTVMANDPAVELSFQNSGCFFVLVRTKAAKDLGRFFAVTGIAILAL